MKTLFSLIALIIFGAGMANAGGHVDPCKEAKELWKNRLVYDYTLRRQKYDLGKKIIKFKIKLVELEKEMADAEEEIVKAKPEEREILWKKYEDAGSKLDQVWKEMNPVSKKLSEISSERRIKRVENKQLELKKKYECAADGELSGRLNRLLKKIPAEKTDIKQPIEDRVAAIQSLNIAFQNYEKEIAKVFGELKETENMFKETDKMDDIADERLNRQFDAIGNIFEQITDKIDTSSEKIRELSENILKHIGDK